MVRGPEVFGEVVGPIHCTWRPAYAELTLLDTVTNPIESHIDCFGSFLFDRVIRDAGGACVVGGDGRRWLRMAHLS